MYLMKSIRKKDRTIHAPAENKCSNGDKYKHKFSMFSKTITMKNCNPCSFSMSNQ